MASTNTKKNITAKAANQSVKNAAATVKAATEAAENTGKAFVEAAKKASNPRISAVDSHVATPDQMVHAGTEAMRDFISAGTEEAQKTQQKVLSLSLENAESWNKSAEQATVAFTKAFSLSKEQFDVLLESGRAASELGRELHEKAIADANALLTESTELSKELLACRNVEDFVALQRRAVQSNIDRLIDQSARLTESWFKLTTEVAEPLNQHFTESAKKFHKRISS